MQTERKRRAMSNSTNQAALKSALISLRSYIKGMYWNLELPNFDESAFEEYFNCNDSSKNAEFEKFIGAAAIEAVYTDPDLSIKEKEQVSRRCSRELQDAFRGAKNDYLLATGQIDPKEFERRKKTLPIVRKVTTIETVKKIVKKALGNAPKSYAKKVVKDKVITAITTATGTAIGGPAGFVVGLAVGAAIDAAIALTPQPVKDKIKETGKELVNGAVNIVKNAAKDLAKSSIGEKATSIVKKASEVVETKVAPVVSKGWNTLKRFGKKVKAFFA